MTVNIKPIAAFKDNYIWAVIANNKNQAVIVDPGDAIPVRNFLEENHIQPVGILITHHHWDHMNGINDLKKIYDVPIFGPNEKINGLTTTLQEKDDVSIGNFPINLQVLDIPGHTLGHIAYYSPGILFCGDTLFAAGCGRLFEGTAAQMYQSLQKLAALPNDTNIYCGHEYTLNNLRFAQVVEPSNKNIAERIKHVTEIRNKQCPSLPTTLAEEKNTNPFLRCHSPELISSTEKHTNRKLKDPVEIFAAIREWKDGFV